MFPSRGERYCKRLRRYRKVQAFTSRDGFGKRFRFDRRSFMRWVMVWLVAMAAGCATNREVTISARPADAVISVDGTPRGRGPVTEKLTFHGDEEVHHVSASRPGYQDRVVDLTRDDDKAEVLIELQPKTKRVTVRVVPVPAIVSVDGRPVS